MQPTERFGLLVHRDDFALDEVALLIAAHAHPDLDVAAQLARLDALALACPDPTVGGVVAHLFRTEGFHGNEVDYYDPENSMLDSVLDRRTGIPITLSVVLIEVARRLGVALVGIGAPGHFVVGDPATMTVLDPFNGGRVVDAPFEPTNRVAIVARMLANLKGIYLQRRDVSSLRWVMKLRVQLPGVSEGEREELRRLMAPLN